MSDHEPAIRQAALSVFLRYGYRRATMGDIAEEAGMSRPALYLVFPNKEAVFRRVVEVGMEDIVRDIEAGLDGLGALHVNLRHVFEIWSVRSFEMAERSPAAQELLSASFDSVQDLFDRASERLVEIIAGLIRASVTEPRKLSPSAEARARLMIAAADGLKKMARDGRHLSRLVDDLVEVMVASLPSTNKRKSRR